MTTSDRVRLSGGIAARTAPGPGETVLWLHGYTMDSSIWPEVWSYLPGWNHIAFDLPGHGASDPMPAREDLPALAERLGTLAVEQGVRHVVGLSFGGMIALQVAAAFPDTFATLTLNSPGLGGGPQDPHARSRNLELFQLYKERGPGPWMTELWMTSPPDIFKGLAAHPAQWAQVQALVDQHSWDELQDARMQGMTNYVQTERDLRRIRAATLLIIGDEDMDSFKRCAELIRRGIRGCERVYLPGAGHMGLVELPAQAAPLVAHHLTAYALAR